MPHNISLVNDRQPIQPHIWAKSSAHNCSNTPLKTIFYLLTGNEVLSWEDELFETWDEHIAPSWFLWGIEEWRVSLCDFNFNLPNLTQIYMELSSLILHWLLNVSDVFFKKRRVEGWLTCKGNRFFTSWTSGHSSGWMIYDHTM